jgi:L-ascorbate metabolism protein UlaG (beta-lactamase superfamily)
MKITWLGHATFQFEFGAGNVLVLDPWLEGNPKAPKGFEFKRIDVIALTHGHSDHTGDAIALAKKFSPKVVALFELASILENKGVANTVGMGKGGTVDLGFAKLTAVNAFHSSSYQDGGNLLYAGEPAGFIIKSDGAPTVYCAGDTCVFGDMALIAEFYQPQIAILPFGGHYTMDPQGATYAARLTKVKQVIPMHYGTFPVLTGKPQDVAEQLKKDGIELVVLKPGEERSW